MDTHRTPPDRPSNAAPVRRRVFLGWINAVLGAIVTGIVGLPGLRYLFSAINREPRTGSLVRRVARLHELPVGRPVLVTITGTVRDGWATYAEQPLGRVWLLRRAESAQSDSVIALSATCPHLGCTVGMASGGEAFECPCHRAAFAFDGRRIPGRSGERNHAPRDLDTLPVRLVQENGSSTIWVEVTYRQAADTREATTA